MRLDKFTEKAQQTLQNAAQTARESGQQAIDPEHLLLALVREPDRTAAAGGGKPLPLLGGDGEIRRVIQVPSRRTKNNPVLIGEPGVGKTAIAEGLAQRIASGDVF